MSIYRIGETQAKPELIKELREFLISIMPLIKSSQGCESVQLFQNQDDPTKFIMIEIWDHVESHRASVKNIPSELIAGIQVLLATTPNGSYFEFIEQK